MHCLTKLVYKLNSIAKSILAVFKQLKTLKNFRARFACQIMNHYIYIIITYINLSAELNLAKIYHKNYIFALPNKTGLQIEPYCQILFFSVTCQGILGHVSPSESNICLCWSRRTCAAAIVVGSKPCCNRLQSFWCRRARRGLVP